MYIFIYYIILNNMKHLKQKEFQCKLFCKIAMHLIVI